MKHQDAALVCFSGGQDSTTCLFWAKKHFKRVEAVCFTYGQKHSLEIDIARKIAATLASTGSPAFFVHAASANWRLTR
jgi:7-cyano-7-deazaguanine synthase